jgi:hypothetical protein
VSEKDPSPTGGHGAQAAIQSAVRINTTTRKPATQTCPVHRAAH